MLRSALVLALDLDLDVDLEFFDKKLVDMLWVVMDDAIEMLLTSFF